MTLFDERPRDIETVRLRWTGCQRCIFSSIHKDTGPCLPSLDIDGKEVMVVGQWPGEEDMKNGTAFSGPQGRLAVKMVVAAGFTSKSLYLTNVLLCQCPVEPTKLILANCKESLDNTLDVVRPKIIIALGAHAVRRFGIRESLADVHGKVRTYRSYPVISCIHTASLARAKDDKEKDKLEKLVKADLKAARETYLSIKRKEDARD